MGFTTLGLSDQILKGVAAAGYTEPTPIQSLAIPLVLAGRDLIGCAETGTGKTAAFVLPMLQRLAADGATRGGLRRPRALVLTPTRELCQQIHVVFEQCAPFVSCRSVSV
jgi:ATP-dependent RNA helicase RhlE